MLDRMVKVTGIKSVACRKFSEDLRQLPSRDDNVLVQGIDSHFLRCVLRLGGPRCPNTPRDRRQRGPRHHLGVGSAQGWRLLEMLRRLSPGLCEKFVYFVSAAS